MGVKMRLVITAILMLLATQSLGESKLDKQIKKIENFASKNMVGEQDFWLQMEVSYGWENMAIVFGYWDDYTACMELIDGLKATQYSPRRYRCMPANR